MKRAVSGRVVSFVCLALATAGFAPGPRVASGERSQSPLTVGALAALFDAEDQRQNQGRGFSSFDNEVGFPTGGLLAWAESYLQCGYASLYRTTGDEKYLRSLAAHIDAVLARRDDQRGRVDMAGEIAPGWGSDRYDQARRWQVHPVHQAMLLYPMLEFVALVRRDRVKSLAPAADAVLHAVQETMAYLDREWSESATPGGCYTFPQRYGNSAESKLPLSMQAALGICHLLLADLLHSESDRDRARQLVRLLRESWIAGPNRTLVWGVAVGQPASLDAATGDTAHGTIIVDFAVHAYRGDYGVTAEEIAGLARSVRWWMESGRLQQWVNGRGEYGSEPFAGLYAVLVPFDRNVEPAVRRVFFDTLHTHIVLPYLQEDRWGPAMLGLARLAEAQTARDPR